MPETELYRGEKVFLLRDGRGVDVTNRHRQREVGYSDFPDLHAQIQAYILEAKQGVTDAISQIEAHAFASEPENAKEIGSLVAEARANADTLFFFAEAEGLTNAWKHGNKCNHEKPMYWGTVVSASLDENWRDATLRFGIGDTGEGFPDAAVPRTQRQREHRDNVEELDGGRGVIMMEAFTDEIRRGIIHIDEVERVMGNKQYQSMHVLQLKRYIFKEILISRTEQHD